MTLLPDERADELGMMGQGQGSAARRVRQAALAGASLLAFGQTVAAREPAPVLEPASPLDRISIVPISADNASIVHDTGDVPVQVSVQAGPLEPALTALTKQVQLKLAYRTSLTDNLTTEGIVGEFLPLEALAVLLRGTGLTFRAAGSSTVTLVNGVTPASGRGDRDLRPSTLQPFVDLPRAARVTAVAQLSQELQSVLAALQHGGARDRPARGRAGSVQSAVRRVPGASPWRRSAALLPVPEGSRARSP